MGHVLILMNMSSEDSIFHFSDTAHEWVIESLTHLVCSKMVIPLIEILGPFLLILVAFPTLNDAILPHQTSLLVVKLNGGLLPVKGV